MANFAGLAIVAGLALLLAWNGAGVLAWFFFVILAGPVALTCALFPYQVLIQEGRVFRASVAGVRELGPADSVRTVVVTRQVRNKSSQQRLVYRVGLEMDQGVTWLWEPTSYPAARRLSERLARALKRDIHDSAQGEAQLRSHGELDKLWLESGSATPELPDPPRCIEVVSEAPRLQLKLPRPRLGPYLATFVGAALFLSLGVGMLQSLWEFGQYWTVAVISFVVALAAVRFGTQALARPGLEAFRGRLSVVRQLGPVRLREPVDLRRLEEIRVDGSDLVFLSDRGVQRVATTLRGSEGQWVEMALSRALRETVPA